MVIPLLDRQPLDDAGRRSGIAAAVAGNVDLLLPPLEIVVGDQPDAGGNGMADRRIVAERRARRRCRRGGKAFDVVLRREQAPRHGLAGLRRAGPLHDRQGHPARLFENESIDFGVAQRRRDPSHLQAVFRVADRKRAVDGKDEL